MKTLLQKAKVWLNPDADDVRIMAVIALALWIIVMLSTCTGCASTRRVAKLERRTMQLEAHAAEHCQSINALAYNQQALIVALQERQQPGPGFKFGTEGE